MNPLGIEPLSVFGLSPVALVHLAADLGCAHIGVTRSGVTWDPPFYPQSSLPDDPQLRRDLKAALQDRNVSISLADGFLVREGQDVCTMQADLEVMAELGAPRINTLSFDSDVNRTVDQFGILVGMAAEVGLKTTLELCPGLPVADLSTAVSVIEAVGRSEFQLLVDTMHYGRSGVRAEDLAALDPGLIGYVQISDTTQEPAGADYLREAITERLVPGSGELDLVELLGVIEDDIVVSLEVPQYSDARAGIEPHERLHCDTRPPVTGTKLTITRQFPPRARPTKLRPGRPPHDGQGHRCADH